ncbi:hypothetical protein ACU1JV_12685 [Paenibacillus sp. T2-29]
MYKIKVHLKNGKEIEFIARDFNFKWSSEAGRFVGFQREGVVSHSDIGIVLSEIVAYEAWEMAGDDVANAQEEGAKKVG